MGRGLLCTGRRLWSWHHAEMALRGLSVHSSQLGAAVIPSSFKIRKLRLGEGQQLAQRHTTMGQHHSFN